MWLESHGNLARHPKTRRLMQRLGWTLPHTIGNLHLLWWWALEYAPTGDLTRFEPEQITYDLDLGDATPEEFLQALVEAGFLDCSEAPSSDSRPGGSLGSLDRIASGSAESRPGEKSRRLHDWPDYTAKSVRPRFRKTPDRWHDVLRSYGRPIPVQRRRRVSTNASRNDQMVGLALRTGRRISAVGFAEDTDSIGSENNLAADDSSRSSSPQQPRSIEADGDMVLSTPPGNEANNQATDFKLATAPIPKCLSGRRNFNDWWLKLQEQYKNKGCPMTAPEQLEALAILARNPFTAVEKLQYSVVNFETSYATLLAPKEKQPTNSS